MQVKDVADLPLLLYIGAVQHKKGMWVDTWDFEGTSYADLPEKLFRAKMKNLIKRGLLTGCYCGCRGDYELTERGKEHVRDFLTRH